MPQNPTLGGGQTGIPLRAGYRSRDALERDTVYSREFPRTRQLFFVRRTVAELRGVKVGQFSDFGLFFPYKMSKKVPSVTSLQPTAYIAE